MLSSPEISFQADGPHHSVGFPRVGRGGSFLPGDAAPGTAGVGAVAVTDHNVTLQIN